MGEFFPSVPLLLTWGAVVSLDERTYGPLRLHQPLIAGTIAGALAGHVMAGVVAGLLVQGLWPALVPSGGNLLPSAGLAAVVAAGTMAWDARLLEAPNAFGAPNALGGRTLLLGLIFGLLAAALGCRWEDRFRRRNATRERRALEAGGSLRIELGRALRGAWIEAAIRGWVITGFALAAAGFLDRWLLVSGHRENPPIAAMGHATLAATLALGLGRLCGELQVPGGRPRAELLLGLLAGCGLQLLL